MRKQVGIMLILLAAGISAVAQNERDAFRYAQYSPTGTARYSALSGAINGFGADFSSLSAGNPGGLGVFKRFEFTFTPSLAFNRITSTYNGEQQDGVKPKFGINNLGLVCAFPLSNSTKWKMFNIATGLNNLARYDGTYLISGQNDGNNGFGTTSFFDYVAGYSNGNSVDYFDDIALEAWNLYLIDTVPGGKNLYYSPVDAQFNQQQIREGKGYLNEYVFSFGGNYDDKLYIGGTIGIPFFRYYQNTTYTESRNPFYDSLVIFDEFRAKATGVNLKLGIIYQPSQYVRLGAAFHTPTLYPRVEENFQSSVRVMNVPLDANYYQIDKNSGEGLSEYQLITPYHAMASIALIYKELGFLNIDYEFVDYASSEMQSNKRNFSEENKNINTYYKGTHIIRAGAELNLSPLVLRAGGSYSTNPYQNLPEKNGSRYTASGGIGFKGKVFFADFTYCYRFTKDKDVFYDASSINPYTNQITNHFFALTLGCKISQ
jgi:hypothetical protein